MIKVDIKIGSGTKVDTYSTYGLAYLSSDHRFSAPIKQFETTAYPEVSGENILAKTVAEAFDYKVTFLIEAPNGNLTSANAKIAAFNAALYATSVGSDIRTYKQVEFHNYYKRVKIVGIPQPISEATEFWRDSKGNVADVVKVEFTIRVADPDLCDFNLAIN